MTDPILTIFDIDGVFNGHYLNPNLPDFRTHTFHDAPSPWVAPGHPVPVRWLQSRIDQVNEWIDKKLIMPAWCTTWTHQAPEFAHVIGLRNYDNKPWPVLIATGSNHAGELDWWKYNAVKKVFKSLPGRKIIWIDDDISDKIIEELATNHPNVVTFVPNRRTGINDAILHGIKQIIDN